MTRIGVSAAAAALLIGLAGARGAQADASFNQRFDGAWVGAGTVQRDSDSEPRRVTCTVTGEAREERLALAGSCRAMLVFTRAIGADLAVTEDGRYRGVYVGARAGPAQLSGRVEGNRAVLDVDFPEGVGGGEQRMVIESADADRFTLRVTDLVDGTRREITNLVFERR